MAADANTNMHDKAQETGDEKGYELSGKIMLGAIVVLVFVLVFMAGTHIYFKWYLQRLRRTQAERIRRRRGVRRSQIVLYSTGDAPDCGLDPSVLNSLPVYLHSDGTGDTAAPECAVCLSEFEEREIIRLLPKCSHAFHIECIDMWFKSHSTCPLCRAAVEPVVNRSVGPDGRCEPGSSSGVGKVAGGMGVQVPSRWDESSLNSPMMRKMLSLTRMLSMGGRGADVDLETGMREPSQSLQVRST